MHDVLLQVRVSREQRERWRERAKGVGATLAEWVRGRLDEAEGKPVRLVETGERVRTEYGTVPVLRPARCERCNCPEGEKLLNCRVPVCGCHR